MALRFRQHSWISSLDPIASYLRLVCLSGLFIILSAAPAFAENCDLGAGSAIGAPTVVHFDKGGTILNESDKVDLANLAKRYRDHPSIEICLIGQADKEGLAESNERLAKRRIDTAKVILDNNGFAGKPYQIRIRGEAFGDTWIGRMLEDKDLDADRRVEVVIIEH